MSFIDFLLLLPVLYLCDQGMFYLTEKIYCKKYKCDCSKCKCWSCRFYRKGDLIDKHN